MAIPNRVLALLGAMSAVVAACALMPGRSTGASESGHLTTDDGIRLFYTKMGRGARTLVVPNGIVYRRDLEPLARTQAVILFDVRNRGLSDAVDGARVARGIHHDVDDVDAVRRHFGIETVDLLGHSYQGMTVILYALEHPSHVRRIVQIAPIQPIAEKAYPRSGDDDTAAVVMTKLAAWRNTAASSDPVRACEEFWSILRPLYVASPADADRIDWGRCDLANERKAMAYLNERIFPSIRALRLSEQDLSRVRHPVLVIHGTRDRSVPVGAARDWAALLGNARLLTIEGAAHAPWIEAPDKVIGSIATFLKGAWPVGAKN